MEYSPPPLFKQGASARAKVVFFALVSICLLLVDARLKTLVVVRQSIATALYPVQMLALAPRDAMNSTGSYFSSLAKLQAEVRDLRQQQILHAQALQKEQYLAMENAHLRELLNAPVRTEIKSVTGEILYDARDAFTRKIVLDRGIQAGVNVGQPVIDGKGVVGQVTRVFPFTSEVTLLTDKDQAIPVQVARNGLRSIAYGRGQSGLLDLHFMAANADIHAGDILITSGIDGVYPAGLSVAKVLKVESNSAGAFGRIVCEPLAGIERNKQLLILLADMTTIAPRPPALDEAKGKNKHGKDSSKPSVNHAVAPAPSPAPSAAPSPATSPATMPAPTPSPIAATPPANGRPTTQAAANPTSPPNKPTTTPAPQPTTVRNPQ